MTVMSNDQWNDDQGEPQWQPSGGEKQQAGDAPDTQNWDQPSQQPRQPPQPEGGAWAAVQGQPTQEDSQPRPSDQEWTTGAQQQPSASGWHGGGQQWNSQGQPYGSRGGPGWNQNTQGGFAPGQQFQQRPPKEATGLGNLFDLSFKRFVLPSGGGILFMIITIGLLVRWLFNLIWILSFDSDVADLMQVLLGELALTAVYILLARAFLEGMSALVKMSTGAQDTQRF